MKFKFKAVLLTVLLICASSLCALAEPETTTAAGTTTTASGIHIQKEGKKSYLYNGTKKVTGYAGIKQYPAGSGKFYYFAKSSDGRIFRGMFRRGTGYYYGQEDGTLARGWTTVKGRTYYFLLNKFTRVTGTKKIKGKHYYFNTKGVLMKGFQKIKKGSHTYTYYFDPKNGGAKTIGLKKISGKVYYFNKYGRMQTGLIRINGKQYFFNDQGVRSWGLKKWKGGTYYFKKKGRVGITGWKTFKGKRYYFSSQTDSYGAVGRAVTGWITVGSNKYYANGEGELLFGWQEIDGKKYYFAAKTGVMYTGKQTIDGKSYTFGSNGVLQTASDPDSISGAWSIRVNLSTNITTIYKGDTPVRAMYCSPGANGATYTGAGGTRQLMDKLRWHELMGPSWGQYCSHITSSILFHSIPYSRANDPSSMSISAFNQLGQAVSHGCIRLACIDAYYIYKNCPVGTTVKVDYFGSTDPLTPKRYTASGSGYGYDPTDPVYSGYTE